MGTEEQHTNAKKNWGKLKGAVNVAAAFKKSGEEHAAKAEETIVESTDGTDAPKELTEEQHTNAKKNWGKLKGAVNVAAAFKKSGEEHAAKAEETIVESTDGT